MELYVNLVLNADGKTGELERLMMEYEKARKNLIAYLELECVEFKEKPTGGSQ